jgi:Protein of unknown function (DUF3301)
MQFEVWLPLAVCLAVGLSWYHALRLRERAVAQAARVCERHGVQLLDQSVALHRLFLRRRRGALYLLREYRFDTSLGGQDRQAASLTLLGNRVLRVSLPARQPFGPVPSTAMMPGCVPRPETGTPDSHDTITPFTPGRRTVH